MRYNKPNEPIPSLQKEVLTDGCLSYITNKEFLSNIVQIKDREKIEKFLENVSHFRLAPYFSKTEKILGFKSLRFENLKPHTLKSLKHPRIRTFCLISLKILFS